MPLPTDVDICNLALDHLGKPGIISLTEDTATATKCGLHYPVARRILLAKSPWTFARRMQVLATRVTNPRADVWEFCYDLPSGMLKLIKFVENADRARQNAAPVDALMADGAVYANTELLQAWYIQDAEDTLRWPDIFADALALGLAARMAPGMTRRRADVERLREAYEATVREAIEQDAAQEVSAYPFGDGYADSRGTATLWGPRQSDGSSMWG